MLQEGAAFKLLQGRKGENGTRIEMQTCDVVLVNDKLSFRLAKFVIAF